MPQRLARAEATAALMAGQARSLATDELARALPVAVDGYRYSAADLYQVLIAAAAERCSLESACRELAGAPSSNLVRHYLGRGCWRRWTWTRWRRAARRCSRAGSPPACWTARRNWQLT